MYENKCCPCPEECPPPPPPEPKECSNSGQSAIPVSWVKPSNSDGTDPNCPDAVPCTPACAIDPATVPSGVSPLKPVQVIDNCTGCWPETEEIPTTMQGVTRTIVMGVDPCAKCEENGEGGTNPAPPPEPPPDQQTAKLTIDVQHTFVVVSPNPVTVGSAGTVTVTVTNTGTANYTGANPTINIPSGFTVTSQSVSGSLNAGQTKTWTFEVTANAAGNWTTTASVSGKSDSDTTSVQAADTSEPPEDPGIFPADAQAEATVGSPANEVDYGTVGLRGAVRFSISPSLPAGMSLNTSTGVISGTPTVVQSQRTYTVSATDGLTTLTAIYRLTVNAVQTVSIAPATQEVTGAKVGVAITPTQAYTATGFTGTVTYTWTLSPTSGLTINPTTGVVSGTPNPNMADGAYTTTVTATSGSQSATATILIRRVLPADVVPPEVNLTPSVSHAFVTVGGSPVQAGFTGTVTVSVVNSGTGNYSGSDPIITLPSGFTVNSQSVDGNLNAGQTKTWIYNVTASAVGTWTTTAAITGKSAEASTVVVEAIVEEDPGITPSDAQAEATVGSAANTVDYDYIGLTGTVTFSISPSLPAGMSLNSSTGVISGTPTAVQTQRTYTVTASNGSTSVSAIYRLTVNAIPTASISPDVQEITGGVVGTPITPTQAFTPTGFTGPVTYSWTLVPASGLVMDPSTGVVSGTPNSNMEYGAYTTTVTATSGSQSATATILIRQVQPA